MRHGLHLNGEVTHRSLWRHRHRCAGAHQGRAHDEAKPRRFANCRPIGLYPIPDYPHKVSVLPVCSHEFRLGDW